MAQAITPYLLYEDGNAAVDFLTRAFGFAEKVRSRSPEGRTSHAELALGEGTIYLGEPGGDYRNPRRLGAATTSIYVIVDDVDAHFEHARSAGAEIVADPADQEYGDRRYFARDPEGHEWFFAQRIRQVEPEEWGAEVQAAG
jgi:PhnB protein